MIKFLKISFTFLIFFNAEEALAQYIPSPAEIQKLIQDKVGNVDLESLGLDNTSEKLEKRGGVPQNLIDIIAKREGKILEDSKNKKANNPELSNDSKKSESVKNIEPESKNIKKNLNKKKTKKIPKTKNKKAGNLEDISEENEENFVAKDSKKSTTKNKKKSLRMELEEKEKITLNEKKQQEKLQKFEELKKFYLKDLIAQEDSENEDLESEEKIIPKRKELAPFALEELPPLPILNRSRTVDNFHIPFVYTPKEYIDIMFSAISMGSISYFNEAFKYVLNPNITNDQGDTILTYAIFLKKYSVISSILAKGADPNLPNRLGHNPVSIAIELVDFQALELLAKNKADLYYKDAFGRTYLMHASRVGFLPAVDLLIKNNVSINDMDNDGFTALSIAYRHKKELVVQYLLKNGAKTWIEKNYNPQQKYFINDLNNRWK
jgi:hypothetical protein